MRAERRRRWNDLLLVGALLVGIVGSSAVEAQAADETAMKDGGTEPGRFYVHSCGITRQFSGHVQSQHLAVDRDDA
jgi:hypothetical protein